jgi:hypothetical protein
MTTQDIETVTYLPDGWVRIDTADGLSAAGESEDAAHQMLASMRAQRETARKA